ncbi:MAG TPA: AMMECR1 domain-containing protein [Fimbriimonadaceae bacterium]
MVLVLVFAVLANVQNLTPEQASLVALAKSAISAEVQHTSLPSPSAHDGPKAVFVTIESSGKILGCRGDLRPRTKSLEEEVVLEARGAAQHDPRYAPLKLSQLKNYLVTVTIVDHLEPLSDISQLKPEDGLVLESGDRKGVVLPWEGKDPRTRLSWAYKKAGVPPGSGGTLYRLIAERFRG